jgi:2-hydroxychromene-2-carboxylate isomerase
VHTVKECKRYAMLREIPLVPPRHHPFRPLTALRASLPEVVGGDQALVVRTIFDLGWAEGGDLGKPEEIAMALTRAGLEGSKIIDAAGSETARESLRRETGQAVGRGVFGVPTMIVGDELFWGLDQIPYLELYLEGKDPLAAVDFDDYDFRGPSAWRTGVTRHGDEG